MQINRILPSLQTLSSKESASRTRNQSGLDTPNELKVHHSLDLGEYHSYTLVHMNHNQRKYTFSFS